MDGFWPGQQKPLLLTYIDGIPMDPERTTDDQKPYSYPVSYPVGISELFTRHDHWFSCVTNCHVDNELETEFTRYIKSRILCADFYYTQYITPILTNIFFYIFYDRNAFKQLLALKWTNHLSICYLSFESSYSNKR